MTKPRWLRRSHVRVLRRMMSRTLAGSQRELFRPSDAALHKSECSTSDIAALTSLAAHGYVRFVPHLEGWWAVPSPDWEAACRKFAS